MRRKREREVEKAKGARSVVTEYVFSSEVFGDEVFSDELCDKLKDVVCLVAMEFVAMNQMTKSLPMAQLFSYDAFFDELFTDDMYIFSERSV